MADVTSGGTDDRRPECGRLQGLPRQLVQHSHLDLTLTDTNTHGGSGYTGSVNNPTSWNFAVTISLSNGFMMYSLAPA